MKARPLFFGLSTAFMFLNLGFSNEIFPYWLLLIPFIRKIDKKFLFIITTLSILILINFFYFVNLNLYLLDSLQFTSVLFAFLIYKDFNNIERNFFFKTLVYLVWLQCFVMILQSIFPSIQNSVSVFFFWTRSFDYAKRIIKKQCSYWFFSRTLIWISLISWCLFYDFN